MRELAEGTALYEVWSYGEAGHYLVKTHLSYESADNHLDQLVDDFGTDNDFRFWMQEDEYVEGMFTRGL